MFKRNVYSSLNRNLLPHMGCISLKLIVAYIYAGLVHEITESIVKEQESDIQNVKYMSWIIQYIVQKFLTSKISGVITHSYFETCE